MADPNALEPLDGDIDNWCLTEGEVHKNYNNQPSDYAGVSNTSAGNGLLLEFSENVDNSFLTDTIDFAEVIHRFSPEIYTKPENVFNMPIDNEEKSAEPAIQDICETQNLNFAQEITLNQNTTSKGRKRKSKVTSNDTSMSFTKQKSPRTRTRNEQSKMEENTTTGENLSETTIKALPVKGRGKRTKKFDDSCSGNIGNSSYVLENNSIAVDPQQKSKPKAKVGRPRKSESLKNVDLKKNNKNKSKRKGRKALDNNLQHVSISESLSNSKDKNELLHYDSDTTELDGICLSKLKERISDAVVNDNKDLKAKIATDQHNENVQKDIHEYFKEFGGENSPVHDVSQSENDAMNDLLQPSDIFTSNNETLNTNFDALIENKNDQLNNETFDSLSKLEIESTSKTPQCNNTLSTDLVTAIKDENVEMQTQTMSSDTSLLCESSSKRPRRNRVIKTHYDESEDEDPFANIELSDDDTSNKIKGHKYYSDDEYVPDKRDKRELSSESSINEDSDFDDELCHKNKRFRKKSDTTKKKTNNKSQENKKDEEVDMNICTIEGDTDVDCSSDIEKCLQSSVIKVGASPKKGAKNKLNINKQGETKSVPSSEMAKEFENFLANKKDLQIKKVKEAKSNIVPLDIPVLNPKELIKTVNSSSQTNSITTKSAYSQTSSLHDIKMKNNLSLSADQSKNACEFLTNILDSTTELGQLMREKSRDFLQKKIKTEYVQDTGKIDNCVKKTFLLLKLAKENITNMEDSLHTQYEQYLRNNELLSGYEVEKKIAPTPHEENDSDCEIIEEPTVSSKLKTVFLNKELSIKIAKKTPTKDTNESQNKQKVIFSGKRATWINESVMVKKVKSAQSFLAQDSRFKKPPDSHVTIDRVRDFFDGYYGKKSLCEPFTSLEWLDLNQNVEVTCNYFVVDQPVNYSSSSDLGDSCSEDDGFFDSSMSNENIPNEFNNHCNVVGSPKVNKQDLHIQMSSPKSLFTLCTDRLHKCMYNSNYPQNSEKPNNETRETFDCKIVHTNHLNQMDGYRTSNSNSSKTSIATAIPETNVPSLKHLCYEKLIIIIYHKEEHLKTKKSTNETELCSSTMKQSYKTSSNSQFCEHKEFSKSLSKLCLDVLQNHMLSNENGVNKPVLNKSPTQATYKFVPTIVKQTVWNEITLRAGNSFMYDINSHVKTLKMLCLQTLQKHMYKSDVVQVNVEKAVLQKISNEPKSLMNIAYTNVMTLLDKKIPDDDSCYYIKDTVHESQTYETNSNKLGPKSLCLLSLDLITNSMYSQNLDIPNESNETFSEIPGTNFMHDVFSDSNCSDGYFENNLLDEDQENECDYTDETEQEFNRTTQPQLETEIESYCMPVIQNIQSAMHTEENNELCAVTVKLEPIDALAEVNDSTVCIKMEQPENVITKKEFVDSGNDIEQVHDQSNVFVRSNSCELSSFEHFLSEKNSIFSQSGMRVRRQFEPDSEDENDNPMSLLIPQDSRPVTTTAKKDLLESDSSDEGRKKSDPKKDLVNIKKKRGRPKKSVNNKEIPKSDLKEKPVDREIQIMTRRMREALRNENGSSDSETDNLSIRHRKNKAAEKLVGENQSQKNNAEQESAIQCSNVDSTKNLSDKKKEKTNPTEESTKFTGFTTVDQNVTSSYNNYVQGVYDKILPKINSEIDNLNTRRNSEDPPTDMPNNIDERPHSPLLISNDPVEQVKCEPTFPLYEDDLTTTPSVSNQVVVDENIVEKPIESVVKDGWSCYPLTGADLKLYQNCSVPLDKLPEAFVETYFEYIKFRDEERDAEIDKLTNLNSLHRLPQVRDDKSKPKIPKDNATQDNQTKTKSNDSSATNSVSIDGVNGDNLDELSLSEDEAETLTEQPPEPAETLQNTIARNSLMNDSESDDDNKKTLTPKTNVVVKEENEPAKEGKSKKTLTIIKIEDEGPIALTVDKTLTKEIDLLHAPVVLDNEVERLPNKTPVKDKKKHSSKRKVHDPNKSDDSSSEEEKMWTNTKAKLLRKMRKKLLQDNTLDDAKRSRLVNDFIERHSDCFPGTKGRGRSGKPSKKKFLEAQKQLRVLTNELFSEVYDGNSPIIIGKKTGMSYSRGRRNIRKVLDKKSLAKSTIIANKEEFDRKRRLAAVQNRLRELLGLEESVKAVVINDELCLEYDFNDLQPIVSVHSFFTKVMKAHQCEGVKFMWDACFENVEMVESGHRGGGCILAHCMGLGKTLQVLALLHTVLSHPRLGIQRILVCCPLSTVLNWVDEINKWLGPVDDTVKVFELSKLKKIYERAYQLEDWYKGGGILIIGYELFRSLTTLDPLFDDVRPTIIKKIKNSLLDPGPDVVVCDEGHLLKNDCSILAVAMSRVMTRRRIILTGTPMQNNLREYYCMVNFVKPDLLGKYSEYSNRFENPITNGQHRDSREEDIKLMMARTHILHKVLEGCLQRQEVSVLYPYLPKKHEYTVFISLTKVQSDLYKHYLLNFAKKSKQSILRDFHMLQKVWTHPQVLHNLQKQRDDRSKLKVEKLEDDLAADDLAAREDLKLPVTEAWWLPYLDGGRVLEALESSNKFVTVFRLIDECVQLNDKLLIFSTSLYTMDALEYFLKKIKNWNLGNEYYRLDGSVPPEVRQKWCREFNADNNQKTKLFLISTRAGSLGLNMTAANRVIILDTSWNPAHDVQSIFRVYRFGQKKDCYIYRLVAMGTMEQKIYERAVTKQAVACRVVDEQQIDRHYNMTELTELYRFDELGECVAGGVAMGVRDLALLRVVRDTPALHAVYEHDSLLRDTGEQELPEHERAAAWDQFQQEHANKQLQEVYAEISAILPINRPIEVQNAVYPAPAQSSVPQANIPYVSLPTTSASLPPPTYAPLTDEVKTEKDNDAKDPDYNPNEAKKRKLSMPFTVTSGNSVPRTTHKITKAKLVESLSNVLVDAPASDINDLARGITNILKDTDAGTNVAQKIADYFRAYHNKAAEGKTSDAPPSQTAQTKQDKSMKSLIADIERNKKAVVLVENIFASAPEMVAKTTQDVEHTIPVIRISKHKMKDVVIKSYDNKNKEVVVKRYDNNTLRVRDIGKINAPSTSSNVASTASDADNAIVLSDDDECVPANAAPKDVPQHEEEKVPLHPRILMNPNFVKLVASEYEKGNPMLDSGAALKAAEYSTSMAYNDITTKNAVLTSGPLYQIAVNLLGITSLRALWKTHKEATKNKPPPAIAKHIVKIVPTLPKKPAIVPVGIMKSGGSAFTNNTSVGSCATSNDECILPDDSGITTSATSTIEAVAAARAKLKQILANSPADPKPPPANQTPPPTAEDTAIVPDTATEQQSQKRVLLRRVTDLQHIQDRLKKTREKTYGQITDILNSQLPTNAPIVPATVPNVADTVNLNSQTICLDSDEEADVPSQILNPTPVVNPAQPPKVIKLTKIDPNTLNHSLPPVITLLPSSSLQNLQFNQTMTTSDGQNMFIIQGPPGNQTIQMQPMDAMVPMQTLGSMVPMQTMRTMLPMQTMSSVAPQPNVFIPARMGVPQHSNNAPTVQKNIPLPNLAPLSKEPLNHPEPSPVQITMVNNEGPIECADEMILPDIGPTPISISQQISNNNTINTQQINSKKMTRDNTNKTTERIVQSGASVNSVFERPSISNANKMSGSITVLNNSDSDRSRSVSPADQMPVFNNAVRIEADRTSTKDSAPPTILNLPAKKTAKQTKNKPPQEHSAPPTIPNLSAKKYVAKPASKKEPQRAAPNILKKALDTKSIKSNADASTTKNSAPKDGIKNVMSDVVDLTDFDVPDTIPNITKKAPVKVEQKKQTHTKPNAKQQQPTTKKVINKITSNVGIYVDNVNNTIELKAPVQADKQVTSAQKKKSCPQVTPTKQDVYKPNNTPVKVPTMTPVTSLQSPSNEFENNDELIIQLTPEIPKTYPAPTKKDVKPKLLQNKTSEAKYHANSTSKNNAPTIKETDMDISVLSDSDSDKDEFRSPSPFDPASILNNVVQIRADSYEPGPSESKPKQSPKQLLNNITVVPPKKFDHFKGPASKGKSVTNMKKEGIKSSADVEGSSFKSSLLDILRKKKQMDKEKKERSTLDMVDLTEDFKSLSRTSNVKSEAKTNKRIAPKTSKLPIKNEQITTTKIEPNSTVTGTSKTIMINAKGKALAKTETKPSIGSGSGSSPTVIQIKNISPQKNATKRKAVVNTLPSDVKKKKNQFQSLEDFSFDDLEDIIELE